MLKTYGIKRILSKRIFLILIATFIFVCFSELNNLKIEDLNNRNTNDLSFSTATIRDRDFVESLIDRTEGMVKEYFSVTLKNSELALENKDLGNYIEAYRYEMIGRIIDLNSAFKLEQRQYIEPIARTIWEDINSEMVYPDNNGQEYKLDYIGIKPDHILKSWILDLKYLYSCYKQGVPYVEQDNANNMVFLYKIMDKIIPISIILFVLLLTYDTVSEEHRHHVSKNLLSQPFKRSVYFREKFFSNITAIVPAIIITIILICLFVAVYTGSHSINMPILTTDNQWNTFIHHGMNLEKRQNSTGYGIYEIRKLGPTPVEWRTLGSELFQKAIFLPFWQILLVYSLEMLLFIIFILTITIYASAMTNKKSISMGISVSIIGGLYLLYQVVPQIPNPLLALETLNIISGASSFTLLSLTCMQILSILIVCLLGNYLFNRKDISY